MRIAPVALMIAALGASGCDRLLNQQVRHPELMWSGHLAQLDGAPVNGTGINLEIYRDPDPAYGEFRYEISNGCVGAVEFRKRVRCPRTRSSAPAWRRISSVCTD
jgi:hypothetical protein